MRVRLERARERRVRAGGRAWVVVLDDEVVGYLSARTHGEAAETFSVVAADCQGRGVGTEARAAALRELSAAGVSRAVSLARPGSASSRISRRLGYQRVNTEVRTSPHGEEVELERWELDLRAWQNPSA